MPYTYVYIAAPQRVCIVKFKTMLDQSVDETIAQWEREVRQGDADLYRINAGGNVLRYRRGPYSWQSVNVE